MFSIVVLKCENNKFFIFKSPLFRVDINSIPEYMFTKQYKPLEIIETILTNDITDEDKITKKYMSNHGIDNVRGGSYTNIELEDWQMKALYNELKYINIDQKISLDKYIDNYASINDIDKEIINLSNVQKNISELKAKISIINRCVDDNIDINSDALLKLTMDRYDDLRNELEKCNTSLTQSTNEMRQKINTIIHNIQFEIGSLKIKKLSTEQYVNNIVCALASYVPRGGINHYSSYNKYLTAISCLFDAKLELKKTYVLHSNDKNINDKLTALYEKRNKMLYAEYSKMD